MDIDVFSREELPGVLRVLRTALNPGGAALAPVERRFLRVYATIAGAPPPMGHPLPIAALAVVMAGAHQRKRLVQLVALAALLARPVRAESVAFVKALSEHLATHDPALGVLEALRDGRPLLARLRAARRGMKSMIAEARLAEGTMGVLRLFAAMFFKRPVNKDRLPEYKRLGLLPEGTLGREYWKHMTASGFLFPGEPAGITVPLSYHDVAHVLAQNEITPLGEIQQGSFQGGNRRDDGFFFVVFAILQFHQGIRMTPATPATEDLFEPEKVLWAIQRGARCTVDMTHQWNYWPLMALPLDEARRRCGLLPKVMPKALPHLSSNASASAPATAPITALPSARPGLLPATEAA